jgi:hypothetical protein
MKAYTRTSLPVIKLNVSSPEGDDNNYSHQIALEIDRNTSAKKMEF